MDHEQAAPLVVDLATDRLEPETAAQVRAHVAQCEPCRGVLRAAAAVREQAREHGAALFAEHPAADTIARYALQPDSLAMGELASVAAHVRACPRCAGETSQARAAAATAWTRRLPAWAAQARGPMPWLVPALGALALVLAWPAYQGVVELPRLRELLAHEAARPAPSVAEPPAPPVPSLASGGAARALVLSEANRGAGSGTARLELAPGQTAVPVLADVALGHEPPARPLRATVRSPDGAVEWTLAATAGAVWDPHAHLIGLLVPASALAPGEHEFRLEWEPGGEFFRARFRVEAAK